MERIEEIDISKIDDNPFQTREIYNDNSNKLLAKSIRERGQLSPIRVLKNDGRYIVICGHRRLRACKRLHKKTIQAIVKNRQKNNELVIDLIHENLIREDLTPLEKAKSIELLIFNQIKSSKDDLDRVFSLVNMLKNWKKRGYVPESRREQTKGFKENDVFKLMELLKSLGISENACVIYLSGQALC